MKTPSLILTLIASGSLAGLLAAQEPIDPNGGTTVAPAGPVPSQPGPGAPRGAWSDDFNRASGTWMGPDWTETMGDLAILNNHGKGNLSYGWSTMLHQSASGSPDGAVMEIDLLPPAGSSGPHVALIAGAGSTNGTWFYTKVQDNNDDGYYDRVYFYSVGNGTPWGANWYQDLITPFSTARVKMYFTNSGDTLNVDIDWNFDGVVDEHRENSGALTVGVTGTGFGIGTWAEGAFDNWSVHGAGPTLTVSNLIAGATALIQVTDATPNGLVRHGYSLAGPGPTSTPYGDLLLSPPWTELPTMIADAAGTASWSGPVPPGTTGIQVWFHAFDIGSLTFTNGVAAVIG
ncbi:MAG: hypothetical protein D6702_07770 [Planctomycetota bacterium]|nr:MAG: hypothetical protein D6702_07770 [Planctomycetota bacterium]